MVAITDLHGLTFGRLTVVSRGPSYPSGKARWQVRCACGGTSLVAAESLLRGRTKSCGCQMVRVRHGHAPLNRYSPTYHSWRGMKSRCNNPKDARYVDYGGRGITVCARWVKFENFLADMGVRPAGMTLDRRDNDGPYCKSNCRWATREQQVRNKRQRKSAAHYA